MSVNQHQKVLFVLPDLSAGGAERVLITLMNSLDRAHFTPSIIAVLKKDTLASLINQDIPRDLLGKKKLILAIPAIYKKIRAINPDIVVSTMAPMNFILLLLRPLFPKTKFVVREAIVPAYILGRYPLFEPFLCLAYKYLYSMASAVISPSLQIQNELRGLGAGSSHVLLYNPVDVSTIPDAVDIRTETVVRYIASGRLKHQKGFDRLIEALGNFHPLFEWSLSILGEGEERETLSALISKHRLEKRITLAGHVTSPLSAYKNADIFLLPSRWEGMPNVALESLACGTPVIAMRDAGGIEEIASLSSQGAVAIADTIHDFVKQMAAGVTIQNPTKTSLLPKEFEKERICKKFSETLSSL